MRASEQEGQARGQMAHKVRLHYRALFDDNPDTASEAAFWLVSNSNGFGPEFDAYESLSQLPAEMTERLRWCLFEMLSKQGVNERIRFEARRPVMDDTGLTCRVEFLVTDTLSFDLDGIQFKLPVDQDYEVLEHEVLLGCPKALSCAETSFQGRIGTRIFRKTAIFRLADDFADSTLNCVCAWPGGLLNRKLSFI
ncbi:hypothetical protein [Rhizobium sp. MHM7A]|uniref:hypothetical protein n=1 Tax=Rhizobium sp. MHM7A TaxID=2583233 RepID=UPI001105D4AD|nr:hypothetical protein [Rhizobium sp. MHM7A]TLX16346.1 hypothetical protein FFR93_03170 [Rhizobium sp. MHM7A]